MHSFPRLPAVRAWPAAPLPLFSMLALLFVVLAPVSVAASFSSMAQTTFERIKQRGTLRCGIHSNSLGFSEKRGNEWIGFDIDLCVALAAAIFDDEKPALSHVTFIPVRIEDRFVALQTGQIDVVSRSTTWTLSRESNWGLTFPAIMYHDAQGLITHKKPSGGVEALLKNSKSRICVQDNTTSLQNLISILLDHWPDEEVKTMTSTKVETTSAKDDPDAKTILVIRHSDDTRRMAGSTPRTASDQPMPPSNAPIILVYQTAQQTARAFCENKCNALTGDQSNLRIYEKTLPCRDELRMFDDDLSYEPLGPVVAQGDPAWASVVRWTMFGLIRAEELGLDSHNISHFLDGNEGRQATQELAERATRAARTLGLPKQWLRRAIKSVGNYGEIYGNHLGRRSQYRIPRGPNNIWRKGVRFECLSGKTPCKQVKNFKVQGAMAVEFEEETGVLRFPVPIGDWAADIPIQIKSRDKQGNVSVARFNMGWGAGKFRVIEILDDTKEERVPKEHSGIKVEEDGLSIDFVALSRRVFKPTEQRGLLRSPPFQ